MVRTVFYENLKFVLKSNEQITKAGVLRVLARNQLDSVPSEINKSMQYLKYFELHTCGRFFFFVESWREENKMR